MPYLQILETEHFLPMEKLLNAGPLPGAEGTWRAVAGALPGDARDLNPMSQLALSG